MRISHECFLKGGVSIYMRLKHYHYHYPSCSEPFVIRVSPSSAQPQGATQSLTTLDGAAVTSSHIFLGSARRPSYSHTCLPAHSVWIVLPRGFTSRAQALCQLCINAGFFATMLPGTAAAVTWQQDHPRLPAPASLWWGSAAQQRRNCAHMQFG